MSGSIPSRATVAPRSAGAPAVLSRPCCLRCSKQLAANLQLRCTKVGNRSVCERCRGLNKKCHDVPASLIPRLNNLMGKQDEVAAMPRGEEFLDAGADFVVRQKAWTSKVEAVRRANSVPPTLEGMFQHIAESLVRVNETLNSINDVLRYQNNLPPVAPAMDEDEDDDEN